MAINIKFTKFDNTPWGFRLAGGSDFPQPLTVIRVTEGSLGECMGLKVGDVVVRLNDQSIINLTHGQAHEALVHAGNNFVLGVQREEEARKAAEAISEETIVPYKIALADLPPVFPEQILKEETVIERYEEENIVVEPLSAEDEIRKEEEKLEEEKPVDANSEIVANKNLTDDEIAQLILEEEELLSDKGLLGVNFKKLRPRASILKDSKVLEELQNIAIAEPERVQELKRTSTFLQKPQRPIPKVKNEPKVEEDEGETYKVVIKKQDKKTVIARLVEKGLLPPGSESTIIKTPEPPEPSETTTSATQEFVCRAEQEGKSDSRPASKAEETEEKKSDEVDEIEAKERPEFKEEDRPESCKARLTQDEQTVAEEDSSVSISDPVAVKTNNKEKIKQLVSTEISLEQQLENVQRQLLALKQLPSEIENHLKIVSEQLHMIMELSGVQRSFGNGNGGCRGLSEENSMLRQKDEEELKQQEEDTDEEDEEFTETYDYIEEIACLERRTSSRSTPQVIESSDDEGEMEEEEAETKELDGMISVKSAEEGSRVKKFIVSYETKVLKSPSPAPSHGSFEPDPKLSPKDQVIQELQERVHKKGKKHSQELWPQAKQLELTQGRRWRCPNDFFNDEMIAEVLTCQAEVIRGKAMGVNFKKYEKTNLPNYDYLMNSSVYKMIHKMEREPKRGIPVRPAKVNAAEDIIERVKSPALSIIDDRSARSVSH
ncbi:PREDICTED: glutamic acid-rich protein-like isoform X1 [Trachymyrmex septentrionalis]|uniref:glutamic acid-rich protein-like isoform X1 n=1 Tax=Trachymyrmex septentrionalis TaxID=34720 RepID=UPI00084F8041|nr:PREDICTED: glutamic acid-rich protein-like isoform X1 [Trachymyrmex septentrionalis]